MILSFFSIIGIVIFWESAALNIVIAYFMGMMIIGIVISSVGAKLNEHLDVEFVETEPINRLYPPSRHVFHSIF